MATFANSFVVVGVRNNNNNNNNNNIIGLPTVTTSVGTNNDQREGTGKTGLFRNMEGIDKEVSIKNTLWELCEDEAKVKQHEQQQQPQQQQQHEKQQKRRESDVCTASTLETDVLTLGDSILSLGYASHSSVDRGGRNDFLPSRPSFDSVEAIETDEQSSTSTSTTSTSEDDTSRYVAQFAPAIVEPDALVQSKTMGSDLNVLYVRQNSKDSFCRTFATDTSLRNDFIHTPKQHHKLRADDATDQIPHTAKPETANKRDLASRRLGRRAGRLSPMMRIRSLSPKNTTQAPLHTNEHHTRVRAMDVRAPHCLQNKNIHDKHVLCSEIDPDHIALLPNNSEQSGFQSLQRVVSPSRKSNTLFSSWVPSSPLQRRRREPIIQRHALGRRINRSKSRSMSPIPSSSSRRALHSFGTTTPPTAQHCRVSSRRRVSTEFFPSKEF